MARGRGPADLRTHLLLQPPILAVLEGRLEDAATLSAGLLGIAEELGNGPFARGLAPVVGARALLLLGRGDQVLVRLDAAGPAAFLNEGIRGWEPNVLAQLGRREESRAAVARLVEGLGPIAVLGLNVLCHLLEAVCLIEDRAMAKRLSAELEEVANLALDRRALSCPARLLGAAAVLLGQPEKASVYYEEALRLCAGIRFRPEIALTRLALAELMLDLCPDERTPRLSTLTLPSPSFAK